MTAIATVSAPALPLRRRRVILWPLHLAALALIATQFWQQRFPYVHSHERDFFSIWVVLWLIFVAGFLLTLFFTMGFALVTPTDQMPKRAGLYRYFRWLIFPALAGFMAYGTQHEWPFRTAFLFSRPALTRLAREILANPLSTNYAARDAGLFHATDIYAMPNEVGFMITSQRGLVYAPEGHPESHNSAVDHYRSDQMIALGGDWYEFSTGWNLQTKLHQDQAALLEALAAGDSHARASLPALIDSLSDDYWSSESSGYTQYATGIRQAQYTWGDQYLSNSQAHLLRPDMRALIRLGTTAVPALIARLREVPPPAQRVLLCQTLAVIGPDAASAVPAVTDLLHDKERLVREFAAWALGELGPAARSAIPDLLKTLDDPEPFVRYNAMLVLRKLHPDARVALPAYGEFIQNQLAKLPVPLLNDGSTLIVPYDIHGREPENLVITYQLTMAAALDAVSDYGPDAAPLAPLLAKELHAVYTSPFFDRRGSLAVPLNASQTASLVMLAEVRDKAPPILIACGPRVASAADELDQALRASTTYVGLDYYAWSVSHALAAVAPKYQPAVDFLLAQLLVDRSSFLTWCRENPSNALGEEGVKLLRHAGVLALLLDNLDPTNAALRAAVQPVARKPDDNEALAARKLEIKYPPAGVEF